MRRADGYTLIEMLVAISMSTLLIIAIGNYAAASILGANQDYNRTLVLTNAKEAVNIVARQIRAARSVEATNTLPDSHAPGAPGNLLSWSGTAGSGSTLILAVPSRNSSKDILYIDSLHTTPYTDEVIFYLDSSTHKLYRRFLANASAPGNVGLTTCPPVSASGSCPADADVVDDVANLTTAYLDSTNTELASGIPIEGTEAVSYTVTETRTLNGKSYSGTYSSVAALRNK